MSINIDTQIVKEKARARGCSPAEITKVMIGYKKTHTQDCTSCDHVCVPTWAGTKKIMCTLIGVGSWHGKTKSFEVDEFHNCKGYKAATDRKNIKELLKG